MTKPEQPSRSHLPASGTVLMLFCALTIVALPTAQAQTFSVLHNFSGGPDGATPYAGLTVDKARNFYGTTFSGGATNLGTVYRLKRSGSSWVADGLYSFRGGASDGAQPLGRVIFGPNGSLYGTASVGGTGQFCSVGCGVVFKLQPPVTFCHSVSCPWTETVLYQFGGIPDGGFPSGELLFDEAGNLYGTTALGGRDGGVLYELTPSGNSWTESIVHDFSGSDGLVPYGGVISDNAGNLYGTTQEGGAHFAGNVFQFTHSGSGWTGTFLHNFQPPSDGRDPSAGLILDQAGNLYGASTDSGPGGGGTIFELSPSGGGWTYTMLYSFTGSRDYRCPNPNNQYAGPGPWASLAMDGAGNLYGTTLCDGANKLGSVFRLTPSDGGWTYTSLHDFTGGDDGAYPLSNVIIDPSGNLYGTASAGGSKGHGIVWEIAP
jgi:uncharacterized repeat protein (TIGR03803 family)